MRNMLLHVPALCAKPVLVASVHGFTDVFVPPPLLATYALFLLVTPQCMTTPLFLMASARHFSHDVGTTFSLFMHLFWIACSAFAPRSGSTIAWITFTLYYVLVHSLPHAKRWCTSPIRSVVTAVAASPFLFLHGDLVVNEAMQKIVMAHVAVDEVTRFLHQKEECRRPLTGNVPSVPCVARVSRRSSPRCKASRPRSASPY